MRKLKVLLATPMDDNPYIFQLLRALQLHPEIECVQYGLKWLEDTKVNFDIAHIQWPEALLGWQEPSKDDIEFLTKKIQQWKKADTKIVATVHNSFPHKNINRHTSDLYGLIYNNCDAIIHLGSNSINILRDKIDFSIERDNEFIVSHGNYEWFENEVSKPQARELLNIEGSKPLFLTVGNVRNLDEIKLLHSVANHLKTFNADLMVAGRLPNSSRKSWTHYTIMRPFLKNSNVRIQRGFIPDEKIQHYLNAADVLVVPRIDSLNSGNVALGFTFGKIVVGPDIGVIGEELKKNDNPVFDPQSEKSIKKALENSFRLLKTETPGKNKKYAQDELNWELIARKTVHVYRHVTG